MSTQITARRWRPVPAWSRYQVSDDGLVANARGRLLTLQSRGGYLRFTPARGRAVSVHVAVLEAFVGPRPEGTEGRHLDGNKANNHLSNLAWGSRLENAADKRRHGTLPVGERAGTAKLTAGQVFEIRSLVGRESLRSLGKKFGVSHTAVRRAATGAKWGHLR